MKNRVKMSQNERDGRTMVLFREQKGNWRLILQGRYQLSRERSRAVAFSCGMMRAEVAPGCGKRPFIRRIQNVDRFRGVQ